MDDNSILRKVIRYAGKIIGYTKNTESYDLFKQDMVLVEACVFNLIQIGELSNRLDPAYKNMHPEIPWRSITSLRNRIVHDYEGVNFSLIWDIIQDDLPELIDSLNKLMDQPRL